MAVVKTGLMQRFGQGGVSAARGSGAGLVLLYAENYAELPAAWLLGQNPVRIGRDPDSDIVLDLPSVSRDHAEIVYQQGSFLIRDCRSTNGVLVDGVRIEGPTLLEPLSEIRIGDAIVKFVPQGAADYVAYRIDGTMVAGARRRARHPSALVGGYQMDCIAAHLERIAPTTLSVMLLGESGTGKEVVARELHRLSGRRGAFCAVNCAAIPGGLLESELFGYKRGAFSGADRDKPGLVRLAHEGTLLLDEIGDMPLEAQAKLLRVLQSREVWPLGATAPERVDVRVVSATQRNLRALLQEERFRPDLYARLKEEQITLPPLRERKEDLFCLLRALLERHGRRDLMPSFGFMIGALHYDWPYNVRELEACAKRCAALADGPSLLPDLLPDSVREAMADYDHPQQTRVPTTFGSAPALARPESARAGPPSEQELRALLRAYQGNVAAVGRQLGKARMQVHRWMRRYGIQADEYRST